MLFCPVCRLHLVPCPFHFLECAWRTLTCERVRPCGCIRRGSRAWRPGAGARVIRHRLGLRCPRNRDCATTRKNNLLHPQVVAGYLHQLANGAATMKSEKVLEPFGLQEFYVDG